MRLRGSLKQFKSVETTSKNEKCVKRALPSQVLLKGRIFDFSQNTKWLTMVFFFAFRRIGIGGE